MLTDEFWLQRRRTNEGASISLSDDLRVTCSEIGIQSGWVDEQRQWGYEESTSRLTAWYAIANYTSMNVWLACRLLALLLDCRVNVAYLQVYISVYISILACSYFHVYIWSNEEYVCEVCDHTRQYMMIHTLGMWLYMEYINILIF